MLPIALKIVMIQGMDNKRTEQNPVELVKNAEEELFQYKKHSYKHNEVFEKYKNELFILLNNYRALSNDERIQEKIDLLIDSFQKKLIEVMRTLSATDYFDRFDERYKPHPNDPHDIQQQSKKHSLSLDNRTKLKDDWDCIQQRIESLKKLGDENRNDPSKQIESQESEKPLKPEHDGKVPFQEASQKKDIESRFTLRENQVLFDGKDLYIGAGAAVEILIALVNDFGNIVSYKKLDENASPTEASEKTRTAIGRIRKNLKSAEIPVVIDTRKATGYIMLPQEA